MSCTILDEPFSPTVVTGFETQNKYLVRNTLGQQVYFAAEGEFDGIQCVGVCLSCVIANYLEQVFHPM